MPAIIVLSDAFNPGGRIPTKHTGEGPDVSPQLSWRGLPESAKELALIVDDPDAPSPQPWVHWVLYKIPTTMTELPEGIPGQKKLPNGLMQGQNSWNTIGWRGPLPPPGHGNHHYHFKLYALDAPLSGRTALTKDALLKEMDGHIITSSELIGLYSR